MRLIAAIAASLLAAFVSPMASAADTEVGRVAQAPAPDPLSGIARWRDAVFGEPLTPPAVTPDSPLLVLVSSAADLSHPEFAGGRVTNLAAVPVVGRDGTAAASIAAAPANGLGILACGRACEPRCLRCSQRAISVAGR